MATLFVRSLIADFPSWRKVYDENAAWRKSMGATSEGVYQTDGNPLEVTVYVEFKTTAEAKAFAESPTLKDGMSRAGVQGRPDVWIANPA